MRSLTILALLALGGCVSTLNPTTGQVTGITLPPGCKGSFTIVITAGAIVNAMVTGSCDESAATTPSEIRLK